MRFGADPYQLLVPVHNQTLISGPAASNIKAGDPFGSWLLFSKAKHIRAAGACSLRKALPWAGQHAATRHQTHLLLPASEGGEYCADAQLRLHACLKATTPCLLANRTHLGGRCIFNASACAHLCPAKAFCHDHAGDCAISCSWPTCLLLPKKTQVLCWHQNAYCDRVIASSLLALLGSSSRRHIMTSWKLH